MQQIGRFSPLRLLIGFSLLGLGILLAIDSGGWIDASDIISRWWPLLLIAIGVLLLVTDGLRNAGALVVTLSGVILLLVTLDVIPGDLSAWLWPLVLIVAGVWVFLGRSVQRSHGRGNIIRSISMFGGAETIQESQQFAGGSTIQLFGGTTLDLRQAALASEGASIDALAAFGGIDIIVPRNWRIAMSGIPLFGACSVPDKEADPEDLQQEDAPILSINALAMFGAVEVKFERD